MEQVDKRSVILFDKSQLNGGRVLDEVLQNEGYAATHYEDISNALEITMKEKPSVIVIDLDEFGEMGWTTCLELKDDLGTRNTGLILLSSNDDEIFKIKGLDLGADDFVVKPYSKRELAARIKAVSRRLNANNNKRIKVKDIEINLDEHRVSKAGKPTGVPLARAVRG